MDIRELAEFAEAAEPLIDRLKPDEGLVLTPYKDDLGFLTIGYGTLLENGLSEFECYLLLLVRARQSMMELQRAKPIVTKLSDNRLFALSNMAYNLGVPKLMKFKNMWAAIEVDDFESAADHALDSRWAKQVGKRADRVTDLLRDG